MKITWARDASILQYGAKTIRVVCAVRNELNGERLLSEKPVFSELEDGSDGVPYMPRLFPLGTWTIKAIIPKDNPYEAPEFISTDAHQTVDEWSLKDGHYGEKIGTIEDYGYGLHNSTSSTTLGCGHIIEVQDREDLVAAIKAARKDGDTVTLEVV
jgi:hypothetical protein